MEKEEKGQSKRQKVSRDEALAKVFNTPSPSKRGHWTLTFEEFQAIFQPLPPLRLSPWLRRKAKKVGGHEMTVPDLLSGAKTKLHFDEGCATEDGLGFEDSQCKEETEDGLGFEDSQLPEDGEGIDDSFACWYDHLHPGSPLEAYESVDDADGTCVPDSLASKN